jgi:hypothetical protein
MATRMMVVLALALAQVQGVRRKVCVFDSWFAFCFGGLVGLVCCYGLEGL